MRQLTIERFRAWMEAYGRASAKDDPAASAALFAADAAYHESPFAEPIVGREAICRYWENGARRLDLGIARWRSTFTVVEAGERFALDCVFLVEFGPEGTCTVFRSGGTRSASIEAG